MNSSPRETKTKESLIPLRTGRESSVNGVYVAMEAGRVNEGRQNDPCDLSHVHLEAG